MVYHVWISRSWYTTYTMSRYTFYNLMYKMYMITVLIFVFTVLIFVFKRVLRVGVVLDQHVAHAGSYTVLLCLFDWNAYSRWFVERITPKCDSMYRCWSESRNGHYIYQHIVTGTGSSLLFSFKEQNVSKHWHLFVWGGFQTSCWTSQIFSSSSFRIQWHRTGVARPCLFMH